MSKNIVVFSDGTGQEGGKKNNTNIYKLFNMIEDRTSRQVAFYHPGLGTGWQKISGNVGGMGFSRNVCDCYRFIFEHFEADDQIFLFGFSRGAATVRSLSSFTHYIGILPKSRPELIERAYKIYENHKEAKRKNKAKEFVLRHHTMWTKIKFLGCYDTVAALGIPNKGASVILDNIPGLEHKFHNFTLSETVENAYHALAIDDERKTFHPILWEAKIDESYQTMRQVWFAGMHTDVGGGYREQNLSDIPLAWMIQQATSKGLQIYSKHKVKIAEDANGEMHNSRGNWITNLYRRKERMWPNERKDKPIVHQSVIDRKNIRKHIKESPYNPWILDLDPEVEPWVHYEDQ